MKKLKLVGINEVIGISGMSLGMGMIGGKLSKFEGAAGQVGEKIASSGVTSAKFISPTVSISMMGNTMNILKNLNKKMKL